jgi:hypothetical protein
MIVLTEDEIETISSIALAWSRGLNNVASKYVCLFYTEGITILYNLLDINIIDTR